MKWRSSRQDDEDLSTVIQTMTSDLLTVNQARARVGSGPLKGGDVPWSDFPKMMPSLADVNRVVDEIQRRQRLGEPCDNLVMLNSGEIVNRKENA